MTNSTNNLWIKIVPTRLRFKIEQSPKLQAIITNIAWLFYDQLVFMVSGFLIGAWVARYLGPEQFGTLNYALAFIGLFMPLSQLGLKGIVIRNLVNKEDQKEQILGTALISQVLAGGLSVGVLIYVFRLFNSSDSLLMTLVLIVSLKIIVQPISNVFEYWFHSQVQAKYITWSRNITLLVVVFVKILLMFLEAPLVAFAWAFAFDAILFSFVLACIYQIKLADIFKFRFNFIQMLQLLQDSWSLLFSAFAVIIYMKIDQVMLGEIVSKEELGYYSLAARLSEMWNFIPMALVSSFFPSIIYSLKANELLDYRRKTQILFDAMIISSCFVIIPLVLFIKPIILFLFGLEFSKSSDILMIHIWSFPFISLGVARTRVLIAENRGIVDLVSSVLGAVLNIGLNFWLMPIYGGIGAAWATVIAYGFASCIVCLFFSETFYLFKQLSLSILIPFRLIFWRRYYTNFLKS